MDLQERLDEMFGDLRQHHSTFQVDNFITKRAGITPYGQYMQAVRELFGRWSALKQEVYEIEILKIDIEELEYQLANEDYNKFDRRRKELELQKNYLDLKEMQRAQDEKLKEMERFFIQAHHLKEQLGELTPEKKAQYDYEYWQANIENMAALEYLSTGKLGRGVIELIQVVPPEMRKELLEKIENPEALVEQFKTLELEHFDKLPEIKAEMRKLIEDK